MLRKASHRTWLNTSKTRFKSNEIKKNILVFGLGNHGWFYQGTRHNIGFDMVDLVAKKKGVTFDKSKHDTLFTEYTTPSEKKIILIKPTRYMNRSGIQVHDWCRYSGSSLDQCVIVYDDMHLPFGQIRMKTQGRDGGHNGIKSIIEHCKSNKFTRIKLGIGKPPSNSTPAAEYVLGRWSEIERSHMDVFLERGVECLDTFIELGIDKAMNEFHGTHKDKVVI